MNDLEFQITFDGYIAVARVVGQIMTNNASDFCLELKELVKKSKWIILDLEPLTYICSAAMGCLLATINQVKQIEGKLITTNLSDNVKRVFDAIKFSEITELTHSPQISVHDAKLLLIAEMKAKSED